MPRANISQPHLRGGTLRKAIALNFLSTMLMVSLSKRTSAFGRIDLTEKNVSKFLTIASSDALDLLKKKYRRFYIGKLSISNAVKAFMIADTYSYADMRQRAIEFVRANFAGISTAKTRELDHKLVLELLKSEELNASEEMIFDHLLEWSRLK